MANNIVIPINKTVDISQGTLITTLGLQNTNDQLIQGQSYANVLNVSVTNAGVPVDLSGSCTGYFARQKDGSTVTVAGTISGNVASVEFPSFVYAYTGRLTITLSVGGADLVQIATTVRLGSTPVVVDPGNVLPNLDEIQQIMLDVEAALSQLDSTLQAAQQATAAINGLTATANTLPFTSPATATAEIVSGAWKLTIGVPQGVRGSLYYAGTAITGTSATPTAYATGIEAALAGDLYYYNGTTPIEVGNVYICTTGGDDSTALWSFLGNWRGTSGSGSVSFVDAVSPNADGDVLLSAVRYAAQTLQPAQQQQALTNISGVGYVSQTLTDEQQKQARANIGIIADTYSGAGVHNAVYRGKSLGSAVTEAQWAAIKAGTFEDMYIGDYWTIGGVTYRIAAFNYYYNTGDTPCTKNHVTLVPDVPMYAHVMNDTDITTGAYVGSKMYVEGLTQAKTTVNRAFGESHILNHRQYLHNAVTDGYASGGSWYDSTVELMTEQNVYGGMVLGNQLNGMARPNSYTVDKSQYPLFTFRPDMQSNRQWFWLRDVVSTSLFAYVYATGIANCSPASYASGVRPAFSIYQS